MSGAQPVPIGPLPLGPQLIGQVEKSLNALLRQVLAGRLTEPEWVTLRLAGLFAAEVSDRADLAALVVDRARFLDAADLIDTLTGAGLLADGRLTDVGQETVAQVQQDVAAATAGIWVGLAEADAAARTLNEVLARVRAALA